MPAKIPADFEGIPRIPSLEELKRECLEKNIGLIHEKNSYGNFERLTGRASSGSTGGNPRGILWGISSAILVEIS